MGDGSGDLSETVLPGTYLILKNLFLLVLGMSVTVFLMVPFSSTIFLWVLSGEMLASRTRFRVTLCVARVSAETPISLIGPLVPECCITLSMKNVLFILDILFSVTMVTC